MAIGDIIDIGGRAFMEVEASQVGSENTGASYAPVMSAAAFGSPSDPVWDGTSPNPSMISILKRIAQNTNP